MSELVIRNAQVFTQGQLSAFDVLIEEGRVVELVPQGAAVRARSELDAAGLWLLPGAIDIHFHVRAPGHPERGTVATETRAAAAGGVTTLFEMPISKPCCSTPEVFRARRELFARDARVHFGLYGAPGRLDPAGIQGMLEEGAIGFKIFTTAAQKGREDEFDGLCLPDEADLYRLLELIAPTGRVLSVHAESNPLLEYFTQAIRATGRNDALTHGQSRPPVVEAAAISKMLTMNLVHGARLHIAHVTSDLAVQVLRAMRPAQDVTAETCPQYLFCTEDDLERYGAYAKVNPPLRTQADQAALFAALNDGVIDCVTTDHSPFTREEKERASRDFWAAPPGAPGVEQLVPGLMDLVLGGQVELAQAVRWFSTAGADRFGVPTKGRIEVGSDADLILFDPQGQWEADPAKLMTEARECDRLFTHRTYRGRIEATLVSGQMVYQDGKVLDDVRGSFVRPSV